MDKSVLQKISDYIWEIPKSYRLDMRVPGRIFASEKLLEDILKDKTLEQVINVATLPGIQNYSLVMPDAHEGYGMAVGGVAAFDVNQGIISPGLVGYDINCGVRLLCSEKSFDEIQNNISALTQAIYEKVPSGVGKDGAVKLVNKDLDKVLENGVEAMVENGYGTDEDLNKCESRGCMNGVNAEMVSRIAKERGRAQLGTIGAGNHFIEIQKVDEIFDEKTAKELGVFKEQITIMIHCGSRGLGHQVATDYIQVMLRALPKYGIVLPDRQLACAPFDSPEGRDYFAAMASAANFAWANRQMITWEVRKAWEKVFDSLSGKELKLVYDVAHNIAKVEKYQVFSNANSMQTNAEVVVHRKGATRAFPGQPVLIPGSMGTSSYVLFGQEKSLEMSFGSTAHGSGRVMSRTKAKRTISGSSLKKDLTNKGIVIFSGSIAGLAEEAPSAYKNVDDVVEVVHNLGLAKKVARLKPVGVIKG